MVVTVTRVLRVAVIAGARVAWCWLRCNSRPTTYRIGLLAIALFSFLYF